MSATLECIGGPLDGKTFTVYGTAPFEVDVHPTNICGVRDFVAMRSAPPFNALQRIGVYRADFRTWHLIWEPNALSHH